MGLRIRRFQCLLTRWLGGGVGSTKDSRGNHYGEDVGTAAASLEELGKESAVPPRLV